jgi:hypothetical protein
MNVKKIPPPPPPPTLYSQSIMDESAILIPSMSVTERVISNKGHEVLIISWLGELK